MALQAKSCLGTEPECLVLSLPLSLLTSLRGPVPIPSPHPPRTTLQSGCCEYRLFKTLPNRPCVALVSPCTVSFPEPQSRDHSTKCRTRCWILILLSKHLIPIPTPFLETIMVDSSDSLCMSPAKLLENTSIRLLISH